MSGGRHCRDCRLADGRVELQHGEEATECPGLPDADVAGWLERLADDQAGLRPPQADAKTLRWAAVEWRDREHPARQRSEGACDHFGTHPFGKCGQCGERCVPDGAPEPQGGGE